MCANDAQFVCLEVELNAFNDACGDCLERKTGVDCGKLTCTGVDDLGTVGVKEGKQHQLALQTQQ